MTCEIDVVSTWYAATLLSENNIRWILAILVSTYCRQPAALSGGFRWVQQAL
jgi:hypothetical protein